jgi:hypothetical protein
MDARAHNSTRWYFTKDGRQRLGPFSFEQLEQLVAGGLLEPVHMVFEEGSGRWCPAASVAGLFPEAEPPPDAPAKVEEAAHAVEEQGPDRRTRSRTLWMALVIVGTLVLPTVIALLLAQGVIPAAAVALIVFIAVAVVGAAVGLVEVCRGIGAACPQCRHWWARTFLSRRLIETKKCFGLVTRSSYTSMSGSVSLHGTNWRPDGLGRQEYLGGTSTSGTTTWKERVPVIRTTYRLTYQCRYCGFRWNRAMVVQVEDFDTER